jgi:putative component of membrane protein insertase Oxa1/YidC/SpoIIIJ protein YidD
MAAASAVTVPASVACELIRWYQRYISPRKGFACARRALKGRASCSRFALQALNRCGLGAGVRLIRRRFEKCGRAKRTLDARTMSFQKRDSNRSYHQGCTDPVPIDDSALECLGEACVHGACEACPHFIH